DPGTQLARDPQARLVGVRALAPYASRDGVRELLARALGGDAGTAPLSPLLRDTAAQVLAASGDPRALDLLVSAVRQGGAARLAPSPETARALAALLAPPGVADPRAIAALGRAGGPEAAARLAGLVADPERGMSEIRWDAALALALAPGDAAEGSLAQLLER